jgi:hypothetical protein
MICLRREIQKKFANACGGFFEKAGVHNVHSKKEFLGFSKFLFKKLRVMDFLYQEMMG